MSQCDTDIAPEFSREIDVGSLSSKGREYSFEATPVERVALAQRLSLLQLDKFVGKFAVIPIKKKHYNLKASFTAHLAQTCGISLEPVEDIVSGAFTILLKQEQTRPDREGAEIDFTPNDEDIEYFPSDIFDVGEMIAQHLSLGINPYPRSSRASGDELGQQIINEEDFQPEPEKKNPFDVLKSLKHKT